MAVGNRIESKKWILMTGAAGFIGRHLRFALNDKYRFWCLDRVPVTDMYLGDVAESVDIGSVTSLTEAWDRRPEITENLHAVIHLAAYYDFSNQPNPQYARVNLGLERLLQLISKDAPGDCLFIHAGSMATLAPVIPGGRQNENSPRAGLWEYPRSKIQAERLLDQSSLRQPVVQLILAAVYSDWCELVPLFEWIELCADYGPEKYFYPGPPTRGLTYCHVEDVVSAFKMALDKFGAGGELIAQVAQELAEKRRRKSVEVSMEGGVREKFLIGQPTPITYREIHARSCTAFGGKATQLIQVSPQLATIGAYVGQWLARTRGRKSFIRPWMIPFAGEHFSFDLTHSRERLGWVPKHSIQRDLDGILVQATQNRDQWLKINAARPR
ncbi:NAD-dependent epimerase/dehydratase family protein [bacterium]|nr:NAD-dependent epimerase/dehydratase family protein [bacterium]